MKKNSFPEMEYEIKPKEKFDMGLRELWDARELFYFFTWRDIRVKYKQTFLGFAWAIIQPIMMTLIFSLIFIHNNFNLSIPYPIFVCSGFILWNIFASGIASAGNSMVTNANIIKKIYFPRLIIPISSILVSLFDFVMTIPLLIGMMIFYKVVPSFENLWMLPCGILLAILGTFGPGCLLAALNVKYRDFRYVIPFLVQFLFFASPVMYPIISFSNRWVQELLAINPMYCAIALFRGFITGRTIDPVLCSISFSSVIVFSFLGLYVFRKTESYFADLA
jgi:lipopolysaccharide transport system permease protein